MGWPYIQDIEPEFFDQNGFLTANQTRLQTPEPKSEPLAIISKLSEQVRELEIAKDLLDFICATFSLKPNQEELKKRFPELLEIINNVWLPRYKTIKVPTNEH